MLFLVMYVYFGTPESPQFLFKTGKYEEFYEVMAEIARINNAQDYDEGLLREEQENNFGDKSKAKEEDELGPGDGTDDEDSLLRPTLHSTIESKPCEASLSQQEQPATRCESFR